MKVRVEFYGRLREAAGVREGEVRVEGDAPTVADLADRLREEHPGLADHLEGAAFSVGDRLAGPERSLEAGQVVGVLPPVSGG